MNETKKVHRELTGWDNVAAAVRHHALRGTDADSRPQMFAPKDIPAAVPLTAAHVRTPTAPWLCDAPRSRTVVEPRSARAVSWPVD